MEVSKDVPSSLSFGGRDCWVRYDGQPRTCLKCGSTGHEAKGCQVVRCFRCQKEGHVAGRCTEEEQCTICGKSGHAFRACPISFANKVRQSKDWVRGGGVATDVVDNAGNAGADEATSKEGASTAEAPDKTAIDTPASEDSLSGDDGGAGGASPSIFDDGEGMDTSQRSWADSEQDAQKLTSRDPVQEDDDSAFTEVRRGLKRPSSPTMRRSRSLPRSSVRVARAKEVANGSAIMTEEKPWISCPVERCADVFNRHRDAMGHVKERHPTHTVGRYTCPLKFCHTSCNNPQEWLNHLVSRHPDFVGQHDAEFFDNYFLDNE